MPIPKVPLTDGTEAIIGDIVEMSNDFDFKKSFIFPLYKYIVNTNGAAYHYNDGIQMVSFHYARRIK